MTYVPRTLEFLTTVRDGLHTLQSGAELTRPLYNLIGLTGIGKTFVLQQLFDECPATCDVIWLGFNLKDQTPAHSIANQPYPLALERSSWPNVIEQLNRLPDLQDSLPQQVVFDNQVSQALDQLPDILFAQCRAAGPVRPLLLLLDSLDNLPYWKWLLKQIIKPLFEREHTLVVCTSRTELAWHYWELKENYQTHELDAFTLTETQQFLAHHHAAPLAETVQQLTEGYPLVLQRFVEQMYTSPSVGDAATIQHAIAQLEPETQALFEQVGLLRRVHVAVMQQLLGAEWTQPAHHRRIHQALADMKRAGLIQAAPDTFERFVPEARQVVQQQLEPTVYLERCNTIADYYYDLAREHPKHDADALIEWLYFSTERLLVEPDVARAAWLQQVEQLFRRVQQVADAEREVYNERALGDVIDQQVKGKEHVHTNIGAKIAAWLYTDGELLHRLDQLKLLEPLHQHITPLLADAQAAIPIQHDLRRAASQVIKELGARAPSFGTSGMASFEITLRTLMPTEGPVEFEQIALRDKLLDRWRSLQARPPRDVIEFIITLNSQGILRYNRDQRFYTPHELILQLLSIAPRGRFGDTQLQNEAIPSEQATRTPVSHTQFPKISLIERDTEIELLRTATREVIAGAQRVLYFEARGGLGKTRLLQDYPKIAEAAELSVLVADIIDMYDFENRKPIEFEYKIVQSLRFSGVQQGMSESAIDTIFAKYQNAYAYYHTIRGYSHAATRDAEIQIHREFVSACNFLSRKMRIVLRFDTIEEILNAQPPKFAFVYDQQPSLADGIEASPATQTANTSINNLALNWFNQYIPRLKQTLILIAGRPTANLAQASITRLTLIPHTLQVIRSREGIALFLQRQHAAFHQQYDHSSEDHEIDRIDEQHDLIPYIQKITGGLPLFLTLFADTWMRDIIQLPKKAGDDEQPHNSYELEDHLIEQIFSLLDRPPLARNTAGKPDPQHTFVFCLFILSCARRGIRRTDLRRVFDLLDIKYDDDTINYIERSTLIKSITYVPLASEDTILFLHDEIQVLIDQSRKLDQLSYRKPILDFLCQISETKTRASGTISLKPFLDHLYYELTRDITRGYRIYTIYTDRLLRQRYIRDAEILAGVFWGTMLYKIERGGEIEWPLLDQLAETQQLQIAAIEHDESVRYVKRLHFSDNHAQATQEGKVVYDRLFEPQVSLADQSLCVFADQPSTNPYLLCDLCLTWASAMMRSQADLAPAGQLLNNLQNWLEPTGNWDIPIEFSKLPLHRQLTYLRRTFFLAETFNTLGQLYGEQQYSLKAVSNLENSIKAFDQYQHTPILSSSISIGYELNDDQIDPSQVSAEYVLQDSVDRDIAHAHNNLAYRYAEHGMLERALERSDQVIRGYVEITSPIASAYQIPLFYNTNALILMRIGNFDVAKTVLQKAKEAAKQSGVDRTQGLVAWAEGKYLRASWNNDRTKGSIDTMLKVDADNFALALHWLQGETRTQSEVLHDRARLMRDLVVYYQDDHDDQDLIRAEDYWRKASDYLNRATALLDNNVALSMRRANLLESHACLYLMKGEDSMAHTLLDQANELMASNNEMPRYAHIVAGKIALQRGLLFIRQNQVQSALEQFAVAMARVYLFSMPGPDARDQIAFERLLRSWAQEGKLPVQELTNFTQAAYAESLTDKTNDLPAPQPDAEQWLLARDRALKFLHTLLTLTTQQEQAAGT